MGFSIGSFLGKIAGPIIGGLVGGPVGAILGAGVTAGFGGSAPAAPRPAAPLPFVGSQVGPTGSGFTQAFLGPFTPSGVTLAIGLVGELLALIRQNTGQRVTRQKVVDAVKHCGIQLASQMFGISETQICQIVISKPRRRSRGISAADLRRTRSTIRKVHNIQHDLKRLSPPVRRHHK